MPSTSRASRTVVPATELLARHSYISELAELNRIAENWSTLDREAHVIVVPSRRPTGEPVAECQTAGTIVTVVARADDADLMALREAAHALDKSGIGAAYVRLGQRVAAAADRAASIDLTTVHGIVDVVYRDRILIRNVVVDAETGFNVFQLTFDGGDVDATAFRVVEHQVRPGTAPLTAVLLVKERELSPIEREAERLSPARITAATIAPAPRASWFDKIVGAIEGVAAVQGDAVAAPAVQAHMLAQGEAAIGQGAGAVQQAAQVYACAAGYENVPAADAAVGVGGRQVAQKVLGQAVQDVGLAEDVAAGTMEDVAGASSRFIAVAGSGTTMRSNANVDDLLAYRASVLSR